MPYVQRPGMTSRLAFSIGACVLGSAFQHGYNTGVANAPQKLIEAWINQTQYERSGEAMDQSAITFIFSLAVSTYCIGGMFGGLLTGLLANRFGRKGGLLVNNILVVISAALMGFSKIASSYEMLIAGRFIIGVNNGLNAGLAPMYLAEISPAHLRGAVGTSYQLIVVVSILVSNILGLPQLLGTAELWPVLIGLTIVPAIFQVMTLPMCPESPKFLLLVRGQEVKARRALTTLRDTLEIHEEMDEMKAEYESVKSVPQVSLIDMVQQKALRAPLIVSMVIMLSQQLSGINAIIFFSKDIFMGAGLDEDVAMYATLGMGVVNLIMTLVSLVLVERAGRKQLHMIGLGGMAIITAVLALSLALKDSFPPLSYLCIVLVISYIIMFATGPGSIPWFLVAELFGQGARPIATSISVGVNWFANFLVGLLFLPLKEMMEGYVFLVFTALLVLFFLFTWKRVPETKNKSPEEVASYFRKK